MKFLYVVMKCNTSTTAITILNFKVATFANSTTAKIVSVTTNDSCQFNYRDDNSLLPNLRNSCCRSTISRRKNSNRYLHGMLGIIMITINCKFCATPVTSQHFDVDDVIGCDSCWNELAELENA